MAVFNSWPKYWLLHLWSSKYIPCACRIAQRSSLPYCPDYCCLWLWLWYYAQTAVVYRRCAVGRKGPGSSAQSASPADCHAAVGVCHSGQKSFHLVHSASGAPTVLYHFIVALPFLAVFWQRRATVLSSSVTDWILSAVTLVFSACIVAISSFSLSLKLPWHELQCECRQCLHDFLCSYVMMLCQMIWLPKINRWKNILFLVFCLVFPHQRTGFRQLTIFGSVCADYQICFKQNVWHGRGGLISWDSLIKVSAI